MPSSTPPPTFRCSDAARERQDPMLGTAPPQGRFLLVEKEAGWAADGFPSAPLPEGVRAEVIARAGACGARIMLIRRPGRQDALAGAPRSWCVVDTTAPAGHRVTWGTWSSPHELLAGVDRLEQLDGWARGGTWPVPATSTTPGQPVDDTLVLVCTHGKKDVCCAVRGRPVALHLAGLWPQQTWECSHTGGDRFAANVLLLPDGATYGGLGVDDAAAVVEAHRAGRPDTAYLRGVVGHPRAVQAAVVAVHEQLGPMPCGSVVPLGTVAVPLAPDAEEVAASTVRLRLDDGRVVEVDVREHVRPAARLTCRAAGPKVSQVPVAGTVRVVPAG